MARSKTLKPQNFNNSKIILNDAFQLRNEDKPIPDEESRVHFLGPGKICDTEPRGSNNPGGLSPEKIVLNAPGGIVPLWAEETTLRWRFRERSFTHFQKPEAAKNEILSLFTEALLQWGTAAPVKFTEDKNVWDFEIVMRKADDCDINGCTLASAFFPDSGQHELVLYPALFTQIREEQVETFIHEIGHIFGLRHFFAQTNVREAAFPSQIFGEHKPFSIMNYGTLSELTQTDKEDLRRLYQLAWSGSLTNINGTPIRFVKPFSALVYASDSVFAVRRVQTVVQPQATVTQIQSI